MHGYLKILSCSFCLIVILSTPIIGQAKIHQWDDPMKPFKVKSGSISPSNPLLVQVNLPDTILEKYEEIPLRIKYTTLYYNIPICSFITNPYALV